MEIVKLIGSDVLPDDQKLVIETARVIRVGFLQQNAFHQDDTFVPMEKQKADDARDSPPVPESKAARLSQRAHLKHSGNWTV